MKNQMSPIITLYEKNYDVYIKFGILQISMTNLSFNYSINLIKIEKKTPR